MLLAARDLRHSSCVVLGAILIAACSSGAAPSAVLAGPGPAGMDGPSLAFRPATALTLAPREERELTVAVSPPGRHEVRLALLSGTTGEGPGDAALDRSEIRTDDSGIGTAVLTAPGTPVTFSVRASIDGGPATSLAVSVSASGFTDLEVVPSYAGARLATSWVATVRAGLTCDDPELVGTPPPDGDLVAYAEDDADLLVEDVPVGPVLAVTARVGHYIGGCATVTAVEEGETNRVIVPVSDRPIHLGATRLALSFGFDTASAAWDEQLEAARASVLSDMRGAVADDLSALLDALAEVVPAGQKQALQEARATRGWDAALHEAYPGEEASLLSALADQWMVEGFDALYQPEAIQSELVAEADDPERAVLTLLQVAGLEPTQAGLPDTAPAAWSADSHDVVLVGSNFLWSPRELLRALAKGPALLASPTADSVARALANRLDCALFASALTGAGEPAGELYPSCTQLCTIDHCRAAVAELWQRAGVVDAEELPLFSLSASGVAVVGDVAEAVALSGSWLGRFSAENEAATAGGPFSGSVPQE